MSRYLTAAEVHGRCQKATDLADILTAAGCTSADVLSMPPVVWTLATQVLAARRQAADGRPHEVRPASTATQALVWRIMRGREAPPVADDPFAGLGSRP